MTLKYINIVALITSIFLLSNKVEGQQLFELLPSSHTGIKFNNKLEDQKNNNILLYSNYYGGAGVGVGDFNNDGLRDLFFAGNLVGDQLYYNIGGLKFEDRTLASGITNQDGWSSGVIVADINNDQYLDIYVTRELYDESEEKRRNLLYLNNGDGTFIECADKYNIGSTERTRHAVFLDYNRDGLLDLFLLNQPPNPGNYSSFSGTDLMQEKWSPRLLKQETDHTFTDVSAEAGLLKPCYPNSVSASDFNNDGWVDIYVANDYDAPDMLWQNDGKGGFKNIINESHKHISFYSMGVDAADINNDGQLDIMTLDMVAEDNFRLKANMSGMNPQSFWDLYESGGHRQYMFNGLHLNQGNDHFSDISQMAGVASTDWSWSNLIADFDNDGWKDIHITNGLLRDIRNTDAAKSFPKYVSKVINDFIAKNPDEGDVSIFDILDLDKALKLIPSVPLENYFFLNNGDLTFSKASKSAGLDQKGFSNGSAYADLDNDGDLEIIVNNINAEAFVYENKSEKNYLRIDLDYAMKPIFGSKVTIEVGGNQQFYEFTSVRGMYSTSENTAHFGLGEEESIDKITIVWPDGQVQELLGIKTNQSITIKYDGSGMREAPQAELSQFVELHNSGIDFTHVENNFDDYEKQVLLPHKMSNFGPALAKGDINGDGLDDVFFGGAVGQKGQIYIQLENEQFKEFNAPNISADSLREDMDAAFFDFDLDGDLDLYVVSGGNAFPPQNKYYQDRLYRNDGKGGFTLSVESLPRFRESGSVVRPFDMDGDGDMDLFIGGRHNPWDYPSPAVSRLLRNNNGIYEDLTKTNSPDLINLGLVTDAAWSDVDGDGKADLVVVGEWMHPTVLLNKDNFFEKVTTNMDQLQGWLYSVNATDLDNDGDDDYIIGNLGLNYKYKASKEEPFEVHYDDFDSNGKKDIVLSYYNYGERFPLRGRSCSAEQVPAIKEKFESYNLFASSNLETVYGKESLKEALNLIATNFSSGVMLNQGNLEFDFIPFPNEAQMSSINASIVKDVNGDGIVDLITSGNLHASEIETTRNDAGIGNLLLGKGDGRFQNAPDSGLYLHNDSKKLINISVMGKELIISANNNAAADILEFSSNKEN